MRINPTSGLDARPIDGDMSQAAKTAAKATEDQQAKAFSSATAQYVQAAAQSSDIDTQAVDRALKLLESGNLDSFESAKAAAEAILDSGI